MVKRSGWDSTIVRVQRVNKGSKEYKEGKESLQIRDSNLLYRIQEVKNVRERTSRVNEYP